MQAPIEKAVVGISALCMLALLPDPSSLLSDHVDAGLSVQYVSILKSYSNPSIIRSLRKRGYVCILSPLVGLPNSRPNLNLSYVILFYFF
jgi:hypothetical protein